MVRFVLNDVSKMHFLSFAALDNKVLQHPHAITIFEDFVYWTDRYINRVIRAHKWHGANQTVMLDTLSQPMGLVAVHPARQPPGMPPPPPRPPPPLPPPPGGGGGGEEGGGGGGEGGGSPQSGGAADERNTTLTQTAAPPLPPMNKIEPHDQVYAITNPTYSLTNPDP